MWIKGQICFAQKLLEQKEGGEKMCETVTVAQAAKELNLAPQGVREYMKRGLIDIGDVLPAVRGKGYRYKIYLG